MTDGGRRAAFAAVALSCFLSGTAWAQSSRLIPIERADPSSRSAMWKQPAIRARPVLRLAKPAGLRSRPDLRRAGRLEGPVLPDTLSVLVLRVAFQPDDDPRTTGNGSFDLRDLETFRREEGHDIDAAPHDRGFTERHMQALHNYWWANSDGALSISADVFPVDPTAAYLLPRQMAYYGFETPLAGIIEAFETLVSDAVTAAGGGPDPIDWYRYDAFVIFHAGADWQGDRAGAGDTPADLPSAYVALGEPVEVEGRRIMDVTVVPETTSQDGFVGGINGVFAHEFGHQLGLPDLYDTATGNTAVGLFALMDLGDFTGGTVGDLFVQGVLPAAISPWSRIYMGWADPVEIWPGASREIDLVASTALEAIHAPQAGRKVALVRAAEQQAFLVEYRSDDLDGDPSVTLFWNEGVIDGTGALVGGLKRRTYEYDALLPGSGVLIWHLDREVAGRDPDGNGLTNLEENTLQLDRLQRFLDIEEADGLQQLGWVPGYLGAAGDFWQPEPPDPSLFGPGTEPSSASRTGAPTGLRIEVVERLAGLALRVRFESEARQLWSAALPAPDPLISIPWVVTMPYEPFVARVAVLDGWGGLHLWGPDGTPVAGSNPVWSAPGPVRTSLTQAGSALVVAAGDSIYFLDLNGTPIGALAPGAEVVRRPIGYERGGVPTVLVEIAGGRLVEADTAGVLATGELGAALGALVRLDENTIIAARGAEVVKITKSEPTRFEIERLWEADSEVVDIVGVRPSQGEGVPSFTALDAGGRLYFARAPWSAPPGGIPLSSMPFGGYEVPAPRGRLAAGQFPDPKAVIVIPAGDGIRAYETHGPPVAGWPPRPRGRAAVETPAVSGTPLTLAGGEVVGLTDAGELVAFDARAQWIPGGLRQLVRAPVAPVTIGRLPAPSGTVLLVVDSDSLRVSRYAPTAGMDAEPTWLGPEGGPSGQGSGALVTSPGPGQQAGTGTASRLYVYPNPARDRCTVRVEDFEGEITIRAFTAAGTGLGIVARMSSTSPGPYEAVWDVSGLAPGVYFLVGEVRGRPGSARTLRLRTTVLIVH